MPNQQRKRNAASKPRDPNPGPVTKTNSGAKAASTGKTAPAAQPAATKAGRADAIKSSRQASKQRYQKNQREMRMLRIGSAVIVLLIIAGLGYGIFRWAQNASADNTLSHTVANYTYAGQQHENGTIQYTENPPVGGPHNPVWQNCGYYAQPVNNENAVHSLEHGAVWITYDPNLPQDQVDVLKKIAEGQDYVLVSPYPGLPSPVVATVWNHQMKLDNATDKDLKTFIKLYKEGPDTPEPGAACSGGTSATKSS